MRLSSTCVLFCLLAAGCTSTIPVKDEFGVSALRPAGAIPPEFSDFNRFDPRLNALQTDQMCATPYQVQVVKTLDAAPGELLAAQARCETYEPFFGATIARLGVPPGP